MNPRQVILYSSLDLVLLCIVYHVYCVIYCLLYSTHLIILLFSLTDNEFPKTTPMSELSAQSSQKL